MASSVSRLQERRDDIIANKALPFYRTSAWSLKGVAGVDFELDRGRIKVNEYMETSVLGIYAPGDINGTKMLAHAAFREKCLQNALKRKSRSC